MQSMLVPGMVRRMRHSYALNTPRWFSALNIVGPLFPTQSCWLHCSCGLISYQKAPMARPMCVKSECRDSRVITSATWRSYHLNAPPWPMQTLQLVEYSCAKCAGCKTACSQLQSSCRHTCRQRTCSGLALTFLSSKIASLRLVSTALPYCTLSFLLLSLLSL
jgi:hypothetical protein